jgi:type IV pilus assembly protein PilB
MVGEIRDFETAEIAIKAALTGHLVLSTLHSNDAPSTVSRLLHMGVEAYLVTAALNAVAAQRLARKICSHCRQPRACSDRELLELGFEPEELREFEVYAGAGCDACTGTGYRGRIAVYEVMTLGDELKELLITGASPAEFRAEAARLGMQTLRRAALDKLKKGLISVEEVTRVSLRVS